MTTPPEVGTPAMARRSLATRLALAFAGTFGVGAVAMIAAAVLLVRSALSRDYTRADAVAVYDSRGIPLPSQDALAVATEALGLSPDVLIRASQTLARQEAMERLLWPSVLVLAVIALITALVAYLVARHRLSRLVRLGREARAITEADLSQRLNAGPPADEVADLADSVDALLDRLERSFEAQRLFASQASHELRTPLAALRTEAEALLTKPTGSSDARELARTAVSAVERSERLIRALLTLARADRARLDLAELDLAELVGDITGEIAPAADRAGLQIELRLDVWRIRGDRELLRSLLTNLFENAVRYSPPGGQIAITVEAGRLSVQNDGPPLSAVELQRIQRPFERLDSGTASPSGTGIGLTVVGTIARAHGLEVGVSSRAEGGVLVVVSAPVVIGSDGGASGPAREFGRLRS